MSRHLLGIPAAVAVLGLGLAACGSGSGAVTVSGNVRPAGAVSSATSTAPSPAKPTSTGTASPTRTSGSKGCPAGGGSIPSGAGTATVGDLDGDGRADKLWLADLGQTRKLGVRTASGATFSTTFSSASPVAATAVGNRLGTGDAVILLNTSRSVALYAVTGCRIVPTQNKQGAPYTFDRGFTGFGSGVACPVVGGSRVLAGYLAKQASGDRYTVTRTVVNLTDGGRRATNGTVTTLGTDLPATSSTVKIAQGVSCGSTGTAHEPQ